MIPDNTILQSPYSHQTTAGLEKELIYLKNSRRVSDFYAPIRYTLVMANVLNSNSMITISVPVGIAYYTSRLG